MLVQYSYDANGNRTQTAVAGGDTTNYTYNKANMITAQSTGNKLNETYSYYPDGNMKTKAVNGNTTVYAYDSMNRLKSENETVYSFDDFGNRLTMSDGETTTAYSYDLNNRLKESRETNGNITTSTKYFYDNNGNTVSKAVMVNQPYAEGMSGDYTISDLSNNYVAIYDYNCYNQLTGVDTNGVVSSYSYLPDGLRSAKTVGSDTTYYVYDNSNIVEEITGNSVNKYYRGLELIKNSGGLYYLCNGQGDVALLTDNNGITAASYVFDAYGNQSEENAVYNPFGYRGEYQDAESGFIYLRNRYYDPETGRFLTEDPVCDGLNWYVYCGNNPVMLVDPWGLDSWVFYDGESFGEQAKTEANNLKKTYDTDVHLIDIWSLDGFLYNWDNMINSDNSIDGVSMLFHGSPFTVYMGEDQSGNPQQLTSSTKGITPNGSDGYYVGNLSKATMKSLNLMSCNGGHLDLIYSNATWKNKGFNHNIAVEILLTQDVSRTYGMDGSLAYTKIFDNYYPRLAADQDAYKSWTPSRRFTGKRQPQGKVLFRKSADGGVSSWPAQ